MPRRTIRETEPKSVDCSRALCVACFVAAFAGGCEAKDDGLEAAETVDATTEDTGDYQTRAEACAQYTDAESCRAEGCAPDDGQIWRLDADACASEDVTFCFYDGPEGPGYGGSDAPQTYVDADDPSRAVHLLTMHDPELLAGYGNFGVCPCDADATACTCRPTPYCDGGETGNE